jgi:hypothetical protein
MNKHVELLSVQPVVTGCEWSTDGESDRWETTCGKAFVFNEDGPIANGFEFCPFCGLSLDELPYLDAEEIPAEAPPANAAAEHGND